MRPQDLLHAANGVALKMQQVPDAPQQIEILGTIVPAPAPALHGLDLGELLLPEPEDVLRNVQFFRNLADCSEGFG